MGSPSGRLARAARRLLAPADALMNRLYGWRLNPLYHSGALTVALLLVVLVTGIYLLFFYKISAPYQSVARLSEQAWLGRWIRSLHRYASDAAVVTAAIHLFRMFAQGRSWGPRALAWISGVVLLFIIFACGWTGYVMVWDVQGLVLAHEGARILDALPLFAEPISRAFVGERAIPDAFFFLNLFLHIALPVGMGGLLWLHVSRVARPALLPPRGLLWGGIVGLFLLSVLWPASMPPPADLLRVPDTAPFDVFFAFWLPLTRRVAPLLVWLGVGVAGAALVFVPRWSRPSAPHRPAPSRVNERLCTGCRQCYLDCPYEAIAMVPRADGRQEAVATIDPALCVSCGICAGSCAPMGVGPPSRTGRDQLADIKSLLADRRLGGTDVVLVACAHGAGRAANEPTVAGAPVFGVECAGSLHTSVVEYLVRSGVGGVLIVACPSRDCWHREGPKWLLERLYHDREAELKPRVDRRRIRVLFAGAAERDEVARAVAAFARHVTALEAARGEGSIELDVTCDPVPEEAEVP